MKDSILVLSQIDFQLSVYATPAIDLTYLLYMITDNDARDNHRDQLLKTYHDQFTATLKGLGHLGTIPSLLDFHVELLKNGVVGKWKMGNVCGVVHLIYSVVLCRVLYRSQLLDAVLHGPLENGRDRFQRQGRVAPNGQGDVRGTCIQTVAAANPAAVHVQGLLGRVGGEKQALTF